MSFHPQYSVHYLIIVFINLHFNLSSTSYRDSSHTIIAPNSLLSPLNEARQCILDIILDHMFLLPADDRQQHLQQHEATRQLQSSQKLKKKNNSAVVVA